MHAIRRTCDFDGVTMVNYAKQADSEPRIRQVSEAAPVPPRRPSRAAPPQDEDNDVDARFGYPLDPARIFYVLHRGGALLLGCGLAGLVLAVAGYLFMPRTFAATAVLKFGDGADSGTGLEARVRAISDAVESARSRGVLTAVLRATGTPGSPGGLASRIEPTADLQAGLIRIAATGGSSASSATLANATATALLAHLQAAQRVELDAQISGVDTRLDAETSELARVRDAYDTFRRAHGISDLETERDQQITSAADLRSQGDLATSDIGALEARVNQLRRDLARTPRMVTASAATTAPDHQLLMRLEGELVAARSNFSPDHPTVRSLELQVESLRRRVASGQGAASTQLTMGASGQYQMLESALATAEAELAAARERSTSITQLADRARTRVAEFGAIEGEATALFGAVRTHQTLVEELRDRRARLESRRRSPNVGFEFLTPAARPDAPESAKKKAILLAALPFVMLLGVALVLLARDLGRGRLRTAREVAYWSRVPVIAATDWPRNLRSLDDMVAAMDDWSHRAEGLTLVVAATEREMAVAQTLAERLDEDWLGATHGETFLEAVSHRHRASVSPYETAERAPFAPPSVIITPPPMSASPVERASQHSQHSQLPPLLRNHTIQGYPAVEDEGAVPRYSGRAGAEARGTDESERPQTGIVRLAREPSHALRTLEPQRRAVSAFVGTPSGPKLRRAARLADRVIVVAASGAVHVAELTTLTTRLGRQAGVGVVLVDLPARFTSLTDRVGPVESFWMATRADG